MNHYHWHLCKALMAETPLRTEDLRATRPSFFRKAPMAPRGLAAAGFYLSALDGARRCRPVKLRQLKKLHRYLVRCRLGN